MVGAQRDDVPLPDAIAATLTPQRKDRFNRLARPQTEVLVAQLQPPVRWQLPTQDFGTEAVAQPSANRQRQPPGAHGPGLPGHRGSSRGATSAPLLVGHAPCAARSGPRRVAQQARWRPTDALEVSTTTRAWETSANAASAAPMLPRTRLNAGHPACPPSALRSTRTWLVQLPTASWSATIRCVSDLDPVVGVETVQRAMTGAQTGQSSGSRPHPQGLRFRMPRSHSQRSPPHSRSRPPPRGCWPARWSRCGPPRRPRAPWSVLSRQSCQPPAAR